MNESPVKKDKSLRKKAIQIKGKSYVLVSDRIIFFNESYPNGSIESKIVSYDGGKVVMKSKVTPDVTVPTRFFTGYSQADETQGMVNKTAALENAETSAVGRALAMMGIGVLDSIASVDEMSKAGAYTPSKVTTESSNVPAGNSQTCKIHKCEVPMRISKSGNPYWGCTAGEKMHFLTDPNQDEVPGQDSVFINEKEVIY